MIPEAQSDTTCTVQGEREVRPMYECVQQPMAHYQGSQHYRSSRVATNGIVHGSKQQRPYPDRQQTVAEWIIVKVQRCETCDSWRDADVLQSCRKKDWPEQVNELSGNE